jgi:hypothetical protein
MALGDVKQNQLFAQDLQNLLSTPAPGAGGGPGVVESVAPFVPRSQQMQQMMTPGMLQSLMPMTPYQRGMLGLHGISAQADLTRAEAATNAPMSQTQLVGSIGAKIANRTATPEEKDVFDRLTGVKTDQERELLAAQIAKTQAEAGQVGKPSPISELDRQVKEAGLAETKKRTELLGKPKAISQTDKQLLDATIQEKQAQIKKIEAETAALPRDATQAKAAGLRKEFDALTKDYRTVRDSYGRVLASGTDPSAAGDLALIFNYMKMLDPSSVVRESEFANAAATGSLGQRWVAVGQKLLSGERLSDGMRADFMSRAKRLYDSQVSIFNNTGERYRKLATKSGVDPVDVTTEPFPFEKSGTATQSQAQPYQEGDIMENPNTGEKVILRNGKWQRIK